MQIADLKTGFKVGNKLDALPPTGVLTGPLFPWVIWSLWHTHGAWKEESLVAGLGATFQRQSPYNTTVTRLEQMSKSEQFVSSLLMAEALAIRMALTQAQSKGITKVCLYSDSQVIIGAISSSRPIKELFGIC
ncbi:uncharacterized protein LOC112082038 [Eutrema salsugineum]|uniref:uncharacterized protein LOC112082038 n=1 Tax=Eutrema salsugineum TaxID=72664 RepID=UPI000CED212C|nr:uncharacterized protein LOC112082038 [Eutrema salsugineum]